MITDDQLKEELKEAQTGNGFQNDLIATTNKRLKAMVIQLHSLERTIQTQLFMTQNAVSDLEQTTKNLDSKNGKLQSRLLWLTVATVILALVQVATAIVPFFNRAK